MEWSHFQHELRLNPNRGKHPGGKLVLRWEQQVRKVVMQGGGKRAWVETEEE
jgi:hypothetical protein